MRPIEDVFRVLEWAKAHGAVKAAVDDVMVQWKAESRGMEPVGQDGLIGNIAASLSPGQRPHGEGAALAHIARKRSEDEKGLGLPEFREPEDILAAEEAAEKGETVAPAGATEGEE